MSNEKEFMNKNSLFYLDEEQYNNYDYNDFAPIMLNQEYKKYVFHHSSEQLSYRRILIEHLSNTAKEIQTTYSCLHLAVYLLDIFMDNHSIPLEKLIAVADACMSLALKLEENVRVSPTDNSKKEHGICERLVLEFFEWSIMFVTAPHFLYYYMKKALTEEEIAYITNVHFIQYKSSIIAAAIIAATRFNMGLPSWSLQLQILTNYTSQDIDNIGRNHLSPV